MLSFDFMPTEPSVGPPLPKGLNIRWPAALRKGTTGAATSELMPMSPEEGPPLPKKFALKWPWKKL